MFVSAVAVFVKAAYQLAFSTPPELMVMSGAGIVVLCTNFFCFYALCW